MECTKEKKCKRCRKNKPINDFRIHLCKKRPNKTEYKLCVECRLIQKGYYLKNRDLHLIYRKKWHQDNYEYSREYAKWYLNNIEKPRRRLESIRQNKRYGRSPSLNHPWRKRFQIKEFENE